MGRPPKKDKDGNLKYDIPVMIAAIDKYVNDCIADASKVRIPIAKECFLKNGWNSRWVYRLAELKENIELDLAIKRLIDWKEVLLEKFALIKKIDRGMAIFSLKQLGWRDEVKFEDPTESINDGFLDAIQTSAVKDWSASDDTETETSQSNV